MIWTPMLIWTSDDNGGELSWDEATLDFEIAATDLADLPKNRNNHLQPFYWYTCNIAKYVLINSVHLIVVINNNNWFP